MNEDKTASRNKINDVVIGVVAAISNNGEPLVAYSGNKSELPVVAKSLLAVNSTAIGREVALLFEDGDSLKPIIMGLIHNEALLPEKKTNTESTHSSSNSVEKWMPEEEAQELTVDGERIQLQAKKEIVLKCGKASITMTRAGKIIIRGAYISTKSSGVNRIKGGSVQIN